jgi:hypothetical protein
MSTIGHLRLPSSSDLSQAIVVTFKCRETQLVATALSVDASVDVATQDDRCRDIVNAFQRCHSVADRVEMMDGRCLDLNNQIELAAHRRDAPDFRIGREPVQNAERRRANQADECANQPLVQLPDIGAVASDSCMRVHSGPSIGISAQPACRARA